MRFIILFIFATSTLLGELTLKDKIQQGKVGDFIVTEQNKTYSLLHLHSFGKNSVILEEICIPSGQLPTKNMNWKRWVLDGAKSHTSWTLFEIDLNTGQILECFSFSKNAWLSYDDSDAFLSKLFVLSLKKLPYHEQRKIGPPPANMSEDIRKVWIPPLIWEGKKLTATKFDVYKTTWPKDDSELSQKELQLYFDAVNKSFPFPHWMQISDGSNSLKVRSVDSGSNLKSPYASIPRRSPELIGTIKRDQDLYRLILKTPAYFTELELFAIDQSDFGKATPLSFTLSKTKESDTYIIDIPKDVLESKLTKSHHYHFMAIPKDDGSVLAETRELWQY